MISRSYSYYKNTQVVVVMLLQIRAAKASLRAPYLNLAALDAPLRKLSGHLTKLSQGTSDLGGRSGVCIDGLEVVLLDRVVEKCLVQVQEAK